MKWEYRVGPLLVMEYQWHGQRSVLPEQQRLLPLLVPLFRHEQYLHAIAAVHHHETAVAEGFGRTRGRSGLSDGRATQAQQQQRIQLIGAFGRFWACGEVTGAAQGL